MPLVSSLLVKSGLREDDACNLTSLCLQKRVAQIESATNAAAAFEKVVLGREAGPSYDILVSDLRMTEEDGLSLMRRIRKLEARTDHFMPAVALTAYASPKDRTNTLLAGFQAHLTKPVSPLELVAIVGSLTGRTGLE